MCIRSRSALRQPRGAGTDRSLCLCGDTLRITQGGKVSHYLLIEIGSQLGRGWRVIGDRDTYETHLGAQGAASCTCEGFARNWDCRHVAALAKCVELGLLPGGIPMPGDF
jgi:hypothetical protein